MGASVELVVVCVAWVLIVDGLRPTSPGDSPPLLLLLLAAVILEALLLLLRILRLAVRCSMSINSVKRKVSPPPFSQAMTIRVSYILSKGFAGGQLLSFDLELLRVVGGGELVLLAAWISLAALRCILAFSCQICIRAR